LKQARHRASRLFLKDGARSSLPQYLQTSLFVLDASRDDCGGRRGTSVVFAAHAAFGEAPPAFFFAGVTDWSVLPLWLTDPPSKDLASAFKWDLLLGQRLGTPAVVNTHCSVAATMEAISASQVKIVGRFLPLYGKSSRCLLHCVDRYGPDGSNRGIRSLSFTEGDIVDAKILSCHDDYRSLGGLRAAKKSRGGCGAALLRSNSRLDGRRPRFADNVA
jgi:hypothetical protein